MTDKKRSILFALSVVVALLIIQILIYSYFSISMELNLGKVGALMGMTGIALSSYSMHSMYIKSKRLKNNNSNTNINS